MFCEPLLLHSALRRYRATAPEGSAANSEMALPFNRLAW